MSWGVGCRRGSGPILLWLWRRPVATPPIQLLAWEPPYAAGVALKDKKKKKKRKIHVHVFNISTIFSILDKHIHVVKFKKTHRGPCTILNNILWDFIAFSLLWDSSPGLLTLNLPVCISQLFYMTSAHVFRKTFCNKIGCNENCLLSQQLLVGEVP